MSSLWKTLTPLRICTTSLSLRRTEIERFVTEPAFRTGAIMLRLGFPVKMVAATLGMGELAVQTLFSVSPEACVVCGAPLCATNKSGVCRNHNHAPGYCRCVRCAGEQNGA